MDRRTDRLRMGVRVWAVLAAKATPPTAKKPKQDARARHHAPQRTLVFDTETTTDSSQRFNFGWYSYFVDRHDSTPGTWCVQEGIVYADDLPTRDPLGFEAIKRYVKEYAADVAPGHSREIKMYSRSEFVEWVIYELVYKKQARVVGFNLPFDMTRIAKDVQPARGRFYGGNSLRLYDIERFRPRFVYRPLDSKRSLMAFTSPWSGKSKSGTRNKGFKGLFLDLRTLVFALTDRSHSLESACKAFGVPYTKREVVHGVITEDYIIYCREDVTATSKLLRATWQEYKKHPIQLPPEEAYSPASIGKAYLALMKIKPPLEANPTFDPLVLGHGCTAYYGGRAEVRIRKELVPIRFVDFVSMYPTVNALMGTWKLVTARKIILKDATREVRQLLERIDLAEYLFKPESWPELLCLVQIDPDGETLPVRAQYDSSSSTFGIGVNPLHSDNQVRYALPDVVAATLFGKAPTVTRAIRLVPRGQQAGMRPTMVRGAHLVDPSQNDLFKHLIEQRHVVRRDGELPLTERKNQEQFLKTLANSTSYGIFAEMNPQESAQKAIEVLVHDESDRPFTTNVDAPEKPGAYCFPPLAALITSAARLMLALLDREVTSRGGIYVFCDTDSMAIVATPDGRFFELPISKESVKTLSYREVDEIVEKFSLINPYDRQCVPGSVLKMEKENYVDSDSPAPLYCYAISSKRYVLLRNSCGAEPPRLEDIVKYSEHGLGHLRSPSSNEGSRQDWMKQAWLYLVVKDLWGNEEAKKFEPEWLDLPGLTQLSVPGPHVLKWFAQFNEGKSYEEQVKPGNFFLMAHPDPMVPSKYRPIAPFEKDAAKWQELPWIDRLTGIRLRLTTRPSDGSIRPNEVRVRTYRDILTDYLGHPESKSLGSQGEKVTKSTRGLLRRRPVHASGFLTYLGKEGNKLDERAMGLVDESDQYQVRYVHPEKNLWNELVLATLRTMKRSAIEMASGIDRRSIQRILNQGVFPHKVNEVKLRVVAVEYASAMLFSWGFAKEENEEVVLRSYLDEYRCRCRCRDCEA